MDPDETLRQMRDLARKVNDEMAEPSDELVQMVNLFDALDEWLSKGGDFPVVWLLTS